VSAASAAIIAGLTRAGSIAGSDTGIRLRSMLSAIRGGIGATLASYFRDGSGWTSQNTPLTRQPNSNPTTTVYDAKLTTVFIVAPKIDSSRDDLLRSPRDC
jgi:hypothetical protein